jgi:hypothetical protein
MAFSIITNGQGGESVRLELNSVINYLNGLGLDLQFSADAVAWHYPFQTGDVWIRFSADFGATWSTAIYLSDADTLDNYVLKETGSRLITADEIAKLENLTGSEGSVFRITLPINGTLSGSAAAATDLPAGWSLSVSGGDLQINHGLGRYSSAVNIRYNTSGSSYRQLRNFDNAYSGVLDVDNNNMTIESISTFYTAYELRITIIFE